MLETGQFLCWLLLYRSLITVSRLINAEQYSRLETRVEEKFAAMALATAIWSLIYFLNRCFRLRHTIYLKFYRREKNHSFSDNPYFLRCNSDYFEKFHYKNCFFGKASIALFMSFLWQHLKYWGLKALETAVSKTSDFHYFSKIANPPPGCNDPQDRRLAKLCLLQAHAFGVWVVMERSELRFRADMVWS